MLDELEEPLFVFNGDCFVGLLVGGGLFFRIEVGGGFEGSEGGEFYRV